MGQKNVNKLDLRNASNHTCPMLASLLVHNAIVYYVPTRQLLPCSQMLKVSFVRVPTSPNLLCSESLAISVTF